jgi:fatty-acyl-CoA synthase
MDSYAAGSTNVALLEETIDANFRRAVAEHPDREALVVRHQSIRWTYRELDEKVDQLARALMALGIDVGDRVGLWAPNCYEWVLVQYATARIGAIMVCLNPAYRTTELSYALNQSGARLLAAASSFKTSDYEAMFAEVADECTSVKDSVFFETDSWSDLLSRADEVTSEQVRERSERLDHRDAINIQYTSGTTGLPKGATLTHRGILNNGFFVGESCGYTHEDRVCIPVPF